MRLRIRSDWGYIDNGAGWGRRFGVTGRASLVQVGEKLGRNGVRIVDGGILDGGRMGWLLVGKMSRRAYFLQCWFCHDLPSILSCSNLTQNTPQLLPRPYPFVSPAGFAHKINGFQSPYSSKHFSSVLVSTYDDFSRELDQFPSLSDVALKHGR